MLAARKIREPVILEVINAFYGRLTIRKAGKTVITHITLASDKEGMMR